MISIPKSAKFIAFTFSVLLANYSLAQSAPGIWIGTNSFQPEISSQETIVYGTLTVNPAPNGFISNPPTMIGTPQPYPVVYPQGFSSPIGTIQTVPSQFSVPTNSTPLPPAQSIMPQQSVQPQVTSQPTGSADSPIVLISKDVGYEGPGDMRTHLWKNHSSDLKNNGISQEALMSMPMASVQKWHNYFHGTEDAPSR